MSNVDLPLSAITVTSALLMEQLVTIGRTNNKGRAFTTSLPDNEDDGKL